MKVKGTCHCGEITYEAEVDPEKVAVCYCTDCQTMTGGTCHVNAVVADDGLRLTAGKPAEYTKTSDAKRDGSSARLRFYTFGDL